MELITGLLSWLGLIGQTRPVGVVADNDFWSKFLAFMVAGLTGLGFYCLFYRGYISFLAGLGLLITLARGAIIQVCSNIGLPGLAAALNEPEIRFIFYALGYFFLILDIRGKQMQVSLIDRIERKKKDA